MYACHLQVAFRQQDASVPVGNHDFRIAYKLSENLLVFRIPFVQPLPELVLRFKPDAFGVEYQAVLKYIFTQYESLFGSSLQLFPKAGQG